MKVNWKIVLLLLVILTSCAIKQTEQPEIEVTPMKPELVTSINGYVELLSHNVNKDERSLEFSISILVEHKDARQRMMVFVDAIIMPFSVDGEEITDYFDILADGVARTYNFKVDISNAKKNKEAKLSISRISIPLGDEPAKHYEPNMYYFAGSVFDFTFDNSHGINTENDYVVLESQKLNTMNPKLKKQIYDKYGMDFGYNDDLLPNLHSITNDYEWVLSKPITSSPNLIFCNLQDKSYDFVVYLFRNGEILDVNNYKGLSFTLTGEDFIDFPLEDYELGNSIVSIVYFMNGLLEHSELPILINLQ